MSAEVSAAARIAEAIVSSESFMWLMVGANHPDAHLDALRPAYEAWCKETGGLASRRRPGAGE